MVAKCVEAFGTVDILVNNAQGFGTEANPRASTIPTPLEDTDDAGATYDNASVASEVNRERIDYLFDHELYDLPNPERPTCHRDAAHRRCADGA